MNNLLAADDPSIKGEVRTNANKAMVEHINKNSIDENYVIYDPVSNKLRKLQFKEIHKGIVKKGDFYVSCADFVDGNENKFDLDFFVVEKDGKFHVQQAIVHKINGEKRIYNIEK